MPTTGVGFIRWITPELDPDFQTGYVIPGSIFDVDGGEDGVGLVEVDVEDLSAGEVGDEMFLWIAGDRRGHSEGYYGQPVLGEIRVRADGTYTTASFTMFGESPTDPDYTADELGGLTVWVAHFDRPADFEGIDIDFSSNPKEMRWITGNFPAGTYTLDADEYPDSMGLTETITSGSGVHVGCIVTRSTGTPLLLDDPNLVGSAGGQVGIITWRFRAFAVLGVMDLSVTAGADIRGYVTHIK